jgi:hypothetical protein
VIAEGQCPHPRRLYRRGVHLENPADDGAFAEHVEVVVAPLAEWAGSGRAFEHGGLGHDTPGRTINRLPRGLGGVPSRKLPAAENCWATAQDIPIRANVRDSRMPRLD